MCVISNIGDGWSDRFPERWPWFPVQDANTGTTTIIMEGVSKAEFEALRAEVRELKKLLVAAKEFDEATGQPDCEMDEKVALIRAVAEAVGVDVDDIFGPKKNDEE